MSEECCNELRREVSHVLTAGTTLSFELDTDTALDQASSHISFKPVSVTPLIVTKGLYHTL